MKTVFIDVDTQIDFLFPAGALYVAGAERLVPVLSKLKEHALAAGIPLISTADAHAENDPEFAAWPAHCIAGTVGQQKPAALLANSRSVVPPVRTDLALGAAQMVVEKVHNDVFTNPNFESLLEALGAERCVVYGVVTEICVRCAAFGLLRRGRRVELVTDAVRSLNDAASRSMLDDFASAGGTIVRSAEVLANS